uniref:(northern house mosquito) hypothetical protein n=1 Tax=Culex pipiens TaxID=7175 RepID=A0A8D8MUT8_CULPI
MSSKSRAPQTVQRTASLPPKTTTRPRSTAATGAPSDTSSWPTCNRTKSTAKHRSKRSRAKHRCAICVRPSSRKPPSSGTTCSNTTAKLRTGAGPRVARRDSTRRRLAWRTRRNAGGSSKVYRERWCAMFAERSLSPLMPLRSTRSAIENRATSVTSAGRSL